MAEYAAAPLHVKLHFCGNYLKVGRLAARNLYVQTQRQCSSGNHTVTLRSSQNIRELSDPWVTHLKSSVCHKENSMRCYCMQTMVDPISAIYPDWVPVVDQVLLTASVFLTYAAGVIPSKRSYSNAQRIIPDDYVVSEDTSFAGSIMKNGNEVNLQYVWDSVKDKLMDSIYAIKQDDKLGDGIREFQQLHSKLPLSLYAIAEGPRLRLLLSSLQWLKKEVDDISGDYATVSMNEWSVVFSKIIQRSCQPICLAWLEEDLCSGNKHNKVLPSLMIEKLNGYDTILRNIRKSGKEDLYAELTCVLRFRSLRNNGCYNYSLFTQHGVAILEDLVINLADGIASMYLELISVDSGVLSEMGTLDLNYCTLSTRSLQKLRNEVALNQWLHQNMAAVVSMYEDRFDLHTLQVHMIEKPSNSETTGFSWWKRLSLKKSELKLSPFRLVAISNVSIPVRRTKELRALTGWRYYYSLFLELADIAMPIIRTVIAKIRDAISFFLVCLIGRSLGLIYSGIRQSLRWK